MKKIITVIAGFLVLVVLVLFVFVKIYVTPEKVKAFIIPYAEASLNRKISVGEVSIGLMKGIDIRDFAIREQDEKTDFVTCRDFILRFQLLPLLSGRVVIDELRLVSPDVRVVRDSGGKYNFEGMGRKEKAKEAAAEEGGSEAKGLPVSLLVNHISVNESRLSFTDAKKELPDIRAVLGIESGVRSVDGSSIGSDGAVTVKLEEVLLQGPPARAIKNIDATLVYAVIIDLGADVIRINKGELKIQDVISSLTGEVKNFRKEPETDITFTIPDTKGADLQKTMSSFMDMKDVTISGNFSADIKAAGTARKMRSDGEIKLSSAAYRGLSANDLYAAYKFVDNRLEITKVSADAAKGKLGLNGIVDISKPGYVYSLSGNIESLHAVELVNALFPKAKDTVFGLITAHIKAHGAGTMPDQAKRNLVADGDFSIKDGKITNAKMTERLSALLNVEELKTIDLRQADGTVKIRNSVASLDSTFVSDDLAMDPAGTIGLDETLALAFDLKLSPRLTKKAMGSGIATYIKNEEGWGMIPLKVTGTLSDPSYTVDIAKAGKRAIEKGLLDKLFKKDKKAGDKPGEKEPSQDLFKGLFR